MKLKLSQFKKENLKPYTFPGTDAAVYHLRAKIHEKEVQKLCDLLPNVQLRYGPSADGWDIKIPWWNLGDQSTDWQFEREAKGWDHEHCSFCHEHVSIGEHYYLHETEDKDGYYLFCQKCYAKMKK